MQPANIQVAYVGVKEEETAFFHETGGITWHPGSVHEIPQHLATRMLQHPDVFGRADAVRPEPSAGIVGGEGAAPAGTALQHAGEGQGAGESFGTADEPIKETGTTGQAGEGLTLAPGSTVQAAAAADPTSGMDVDQLRDFIRSKGLAGKIPGYNNTGLEKLRPKVIAALQHAGEGK